jgi:hypothetical protein
MAEEKVEGNRINGNDRIKTVADMFRAIQEEIDAVKSGNLPLDTARVVQRGRALQLKAAELNLNFLRVSRAERSGKRELNILTGAVEDIGKEVRPV